MIMRQLQIIEIYKKHIAQEFIKELSEYI